MSTSIPQHDENPESRAAEIKRAREYFQYDYVYYNMGFAKKQWLELEGHDLDEFDVHKPVSGPHHKGLLGMVEGAAKHIIDDVQGDVQGFLSSHYMSGYTPKLSHQFMGAYLKWLVNRAAADAQLMGRDVEGAIKQARADGEEALRKLCGDKPAKQDVMKHLMQLAEQKWPAHGRGKSIQTYEGMFPLIKKPAMAGLWDEDWAFAYQTVAGCVPTHIESIDALPDHFPVTADLYAKVMGEGHELEPDLRNKRLFLVNYSIFEGYSGAVSYGAQKYTYAPLALFAWRDTANHQGFGLTPVAIQCGQRPGDEHPIFTPLDGWRWKMARFCVQVAAATYRGANLHFGCLHIVTDRICIALKRSLATNHPLYLLLARSFFETLAVNQTTQSFTYPDGFSTKLLAPPMDASARLMLEGAEGFKFGDWSPPRLFERRGVADPKILPVYPFRDDTTLLWSAITSFCEEYVKLYYSTDQAVAADVEIQAWVRELQSPEGGRLRGVGRDGIVDTIEDLVLLVSQVMYHTSGFHSAVNYAGFEVLSFPPAMSYAGFAPAPTWDTPDTEEAFLAFLPPMDYAWSQFLLDYDQISIWDNNIATFPEGWFSDPRVGPVVERFHAALDHVTQQIDTANAQRPQAYPYQSPPNVTASVEC